MTTYYSERDPFLHEEITFYVLPKNDKTLIPQNLYDSKPEDGHCFGSLETALNYCKDNYTPTNTSQFVFHIGTKSVNSVIIHSTGSDEIKGFNYQVMGRKTNN